MSNAQLAPIALADAVSFSQAFGKPITAEVGKRPRCFALADSSGMIAVAVFCNPRTQDKQLLYTTELLHFAHQPQIDGHVSLAALIEHFMGLPSSLDLFVYSSTLAGDVEAYSSLGLSATSNVISPEGVLYGWRNPLFSYYTYRITSTRDESYYYGRHRTRLTDPVLMAQDGYLGSGGKKYQHWIQSVSVESLRKEIVGIYSTWAEVVLAEIELIGDKNSTDPRCKNSKTGGTGLASYFPEYTVELCPVHGETKFRGGCKKCSVQDSRSLKVCSKHGESHHMGDVCYKCVSDKSWTEKECPIHGVCIHHGSSCQKCNSSSGLASRECSVHGQTLHRGQTCLTCTTEKSIAVKECSVHGKVKHVGDHCKKCLGANTITEQECSIHGPTPFKGDGCCKCSTAKTWTLQECEVHGESKHRSGKCEPCAVKKRVAAQKSLETTENCPTHGSAAHYLGKCKRCKAQKQITMGDCPVHGVTKFNGKTCGKCFVAKIWTTSTCETHGETKHRSGNCERCSRTAQWAARKGREA